MMISKKNKYISASLGISVTSLYFIISLMNITNLYIMYLLATVVAVHFLYATTLISNLNHDDWIQIMIDSKNPNKRELLQLQKINGFMLLFLFIFILFGIIDYWWFIVCSMISFVIYVIYKYKSLNIGEKLQDANL